MHSLLRTALIAAIGLCPQAFAPQAYANDVFPLAPGNYWVYEDSETGSRFQVNVGYSQIYVNQHVYDVLIGYGGRNLWVRTNEAGDMVVWDEENEVEQLLLSFTPSGGLWFSSFGRACETEGQAQQERGRSDGPAGSWSVVEIQYRTYRCSDTGDRLEQFAENIGMVRRDVDTIAGLRTFHLVEAQLGNLTILAKPTGSFAISAVKGQRSWDVTLRVSLPPGPGLTLRFPSGQEFDAHLRNHEGEIIYTWSANQLFPQAPHEISFTRQWSASFQVPYPPATTTVPEDYTLEAWLTTGVGEPDYAAVTIVTPPETDKLVRADRALRRHIQ